MTWSRISEVPLFLVSIGIVQTCALPFLCNVKPPHGVRSFPTCLSQVIRSSKLKLTDDSIITSAVPINAENIKAASAQLIIDDILFPESHLRDRMNLGHKSVDLFQEKVSKTRGTKKEVVNVDDESLTLTYAEFPIHSFDIIVERMKFWKLKNDKTAEGNPERPKTFIDLGSGCGRLIMYASLRMNEMRGESSGNGNWIFHGIEISQILHNRACSILYEAVEKGYFTRKHETFSDRNHQPMNNSFSKVHLHCGEASSFPTILGDADMIFAYSTAFPTIPNYFDLDLKAMVLTPAWSAMLANYCSRGCVVATTDRALNCKDGWIHLETLDVDNPDLFGSTCYIQVLK